LADATKYMSKRIFTPDQIDELLKNPHVVKCSEKSITYHKDFKLLVIRQYQDEGLSAIQIFKQAGFNLDIIGRKVPKDCLYDWIEIWKTKGVDGFSKEQRGITKGGTNGKRSFKNLTDSEKIKELEMKVAYLKAENAFLARLRAKRKG